MNHFAIFTAFITLFLIIAGASVTSTGSGLAVPDWPLSFGQFFPRMEGGVFFEHGHRMIAGLVGVFTLILAVWLWLKEKRRWLCWLGTFAFLLILLQALLGGITVLYGLPQKISVAHAVLAQTFFCLIVTIALFTLPAHASFSHSSQHLSFLSAFTTLLIFFQLIFGSLSRHGAGQLFLYLHISLALAITCLAIIIFRKAWISFRFHSFYFYPVATLVILTGAQILLGITAVLPKFGLGSFFLAAISPWTTVIHVGAGALILANSLIVTLEQYES